MNLNNGPRNRNVNISTAVIQCIPPERRVTNSWEQPHHSVKHDAHNPAASRAETPRRPSPITEQRGLDFVGYVFYRHKTMLRKATKKRMIRGTRKHANHPEKLQHLVGAYNGWASFGSTRTLRQTFIDPHRKVA